MSDAHDVRSRSNSADVAFRLVRISFNRNVLIGVKMFNRKIFIGGLSYSTDEGNIIHLFPNNS